MKIAVIGTGYVGLPTAACFAELGNNVVGVDIDERKIRMLQKGVMPFYEEGLEELVKKNGDGGRLSFTASIADAVQDAELALLCVGTPVGENGVANVGYLLEAAREVITHANQYIVLAEKSTVPAGTGDALKLIAREYGNGKDFDVAAVPEFLREGYAVEDTFFPSRVVIGTESERARAVLERIYAPFVGKKNRQGKSIEIHCTNIPTAEYSKHVANMLLASRISLMNVVAEGAEAVGADIADVRKIVGSDERIGPHFLNTGIGYGGYCFPKDMAALIALLENKGVDASILKEVVAVNAHQRKRYVAKVEKLCNGVAGKTLGVLGLAFKPKTDDMREAPSIDIIRALQGRDAKIRAYDPQAMENARRIFGESIAYCINPVHAIDKSHALLLLTEWEEFRSIDFEQAKVLMKAHVVVDGRNLYDPALVRQHGFVYAGMGR